MARPCQFSDLGMLAVDPAQPAQKDVKCVVFVLTSLDLPEFPLSVLQLKFEKKSSFGGLCCMYPLVSWKIHHLSWFHHQKWWISTMPGWSPEAGLDSWTRRMTTYFEALKWVCFLTNYKKKTEMQVTLLPLWPRIQLFHGLSLEVDMANAKSLESCPLFSYDLTEIHVVSNHVIRFYWLKGYDMWWRQQFQDGCYGNLTILEVLPFSWLQGATDGQ